LKEEEMRARRVGDGPEFRLLQDEQEIGRVDATAVSFRGFATREDAALAAAVAHLALTRRRGEKREPVTGPAEALIMDHGPGQAVVAPAGVLARLLPPAAEESEGGGWGFEIGLLPEEGVEVFAIARARVMWRALRSAGLYRRMQQFWADHSAAV
jgi:hypothetical protein